jgi:antagonist of KipI
VSLRILQPGLQTTVQDLGRWGHQREGIPVSGAMDPWALRVGNMLVGNGDSAAGLEITLTGPTLEFSESTLIALTGTDLGAEIEDRPVPFWHALWVAGGMTLSFHGGQSGCRAYLAVAGGIDVPARLGSRSTFVRAALGGQAGRALQRDDLLECGAPSALALRVAKALAPETGPFAAAHWSPAQSLRPRYSAAPTVRLIGGAHLDLLNPASRARLFDGEFRVSPQSDRMGYRLEGPSLELRAPVELLSEAVVFGTVQLPPGGGPIILMADRQTTGGYPRIGEVASVDLPLLAQLKPADRVRFRPISLEDAQKQYLAREQDLAQARHAVTFLYR